MTKQMKIGFSSQIVRFQWLEQTSMWLLAGLNKDEIRLELYGYLDTWLMSNGTIPSATIRKATNLLLNIWIAPANELLEFRDEGVGLLGLHSEYRTAVHWGMIMTSYPFWARVADAVGRLLRLQKSVGASQIKRRMHEQFGDRELVSRATRTVLRSFVNWGVLQDGPVKGMYFQGPELACTEPKLTAWLVEAVLRASSNEKVVLNSLLNSPALFPFDIMHISADHLSTLAPGLDILCQGFDDEFVFLQS